MYLIKNALLVNEGNTLRASVLVDGDRIADIFKGAVPDEVVEKATVIEAEDYYLLPGVIDAHVHFRTPGFEYKGNFASESRAAVAGGVTTVFDMPNTKPQTTSLQALEDKFKLMSESMLTNYSAYLGVTKDNVEDIKNVDNSRVCALKLFMGSSTGNMCVDDDAALAQVFKNAHSLICVHAEDDIIIRENLEHYKQLYADKLMPISVHPLVRSAEACFLSSSYAMVMALQHGKRLHIMHISTRDELSLFDDVPLQDKQITAETCPQYLVFSDADYATKGGYIKCNPAIKSADDRDALLAALSTNLIDTIATDHAPHTKDEKQGDYLAAMSGMPSIQFSLINVLELADRGILSIEQVVEKMCHNPARLYRVKDRGFIKKGYFADLCLVKKTTPWVLTEQDILSACGWSPYEGMLFSHQVDYTFVSGHLVYQKGSFDDSKKGQQVLFN